MSEFDTVPEFMTQYHGYTVDGTWCGFVMDTNPYAAMEKLNEMRGDREPVAEITEVYRGR